ncbi:hypothetical protein MHU86_16207 [Fragilaria crotonensis]|nr:hypothetical protein MHU86_16207 [Fragilaria crotonensis]
MPRHSSSQSHGRIRPHQRATNDVVPIIGESIPIKTLHSMGMLETEGHDRQAKTKKDYRNRIKHIYEFMKKAYPQYCELGGIRKLGNADLGVFHHKNTHDLRYEGLNVQIFKAFLTTKKIKDNGNTSSFEQIRKYNDAVLWGAECSKEQLPTSYYTEMEKWMMSYRKEAATAKKDGRIDECEADPVSFSLFRMWMTWALELKNPFVWTFGLLQWSFMAFNQYWDTWSITFALKRIRLWELNDILDANTPELSAYIRPKHANTHSIRKGSGTYSQSGTTCPPPATATAGRGEWSLGRVFDLYLYLAEPADTYLGRILAGLDPLNENFASLPPHFIPIDPMGNAQINEAMHLMYGPILQRWSGNSINPTGLLLRLLPAVIHHSEFLYDWIRKVPGHPFGLIPLLHDKDLLLNLKALVTTEPTESMKTATGIPPHIQSAVMVKKVLEICTTVLEEVRDITMQVKESVAEAYEAKMSANGQMTADRMNFILDDFRKHMEHLLDCRMSKLHSKIDSIRTHLLRYGQTNNTSGDDISIGNNTDGGVDFAGEEEQISNHGGGAIYRVYSHNGHFWQVPKPFEFPTQVDLRGAFRLWLKGMPGYEIETKDSVSKAAPIRPFRLLDPKMLPKSVRAVFHLHWEPILQMMCQTPGLDIPRNPSTITATQFLELYSVAFEYLKTKRVSYVFDKGPKVKPQTWKISTWSKHARASEIIKHGKQVDKDNLPQATRFNQPRTQRAKRKRTPISRPEKRHAAVIQHNNHERRSMVLGQEFTVEQEVSVRQE